MLRRALTSLICALAIVGSAYGQDVFVPRELKATPAHPPKEHTAEVKPSKPKEAADVKPAAKEQTADTTKAKSPKSEKAPVPAEEPGKKVAKVEPAKEKAEKPAAKDKT